MNEPLARISRDVIPALAIGAILAILTVYFQRGFVPGDALTYLAAGERLNAGHLLYALSPGDRQLDVKPPYWTVPLLSPPPIAVLFRPIAVLGDLGAYVWWALCIATIAGTCLALMHRRPVATGLAMLALAIPIVYEIGVGNLNALVLGGLVGAWYLLVRHRHGWAGAILAALTALKLAPWIFAWWLITQRRWSALLAFTLAGLVLLAVSIGGAGMDAHLEYVSIIRYTAIVGTSDLSLAGLARTAGLPETASVMLPFVALMVGALCMWLLRERTSVSWGVAVVTMLAASPVVNVNWFTLLLAGLAPLAWPLETATPRTGYRPGATAMDPSGSL